MKKHIAPSAPARLVFVVICCVLPLRSTVQAASLFWNGANNSSSPAAGGTGNWNTSNNWRSGSDTGSQATWSGGDSATLAGTAGTITINTSTVSAATVTVNTTGYIITSTASSRGLAATSLVLGAGKSIEFNMNTTGGGGSGVWALGGITFGSGASLTISGTASASNANRVDLNGASSTITGGSITLAGTGAGASGFVGTANGVTLNTSITNNSSTSATMLGATSGNTFTYSGTISGSAGLLFAAGGSGGAGTVILSAANAYQGATVFNASNSGTLKLGINNALSTVSDVTMASSTGQGGILDLNGFDQEIASLTSGAGGGSITNSASGTATNTLTISGSATPAAFGLVISDGSTRKTALTRAGSGSTTLSNTNTYTGGTTVSGGTLTLGHATNTLADTGAVTVSGGTLSIGANSDTVGAVTLSSGSITGSGGTLTASSYALQSGSVTAILAGSGTVTKTTGGTVTLATGNTYTGKTTISGGYIAGSGESIFGANPGSFTADQITLNGGGIRATGTMNFSSNRGITLGSSGGTFDSNGSTITLTNVVTGSGGLTKEGAGTLSLAASHAFTGGVTINAGVVQLNNAGGLNSTTPNSVNFGAGVASGTKLQLNGNNVTISALNTHATPGAAVVESGSGTAGTDTLTVNNSNASNFAGVLQDGSTRSLALTKQGSGTMVLSGVNTYSGSTILNGGNLQVGQSGAGKTGTGSVSVNGSGAVLSGSGSVDGTTTSVILGTLKPGDNGGASTGTLNTKSLVFTPVSATTVAELQIVSNSAFDVLNVTGNITLNGNSNIVVNGSGYSAQVGDSFTLIDWTGLVSLGGFSTGTNLRTGNNLEGNEGNLDLPDISGIGFWQIGSLADGGALSLTIVAVPEPGRGLLLLAGLMVFARRRCR